MRQLIYYFIFIAYVFSSRGIASSLVTSENYASSSVAQAMRIYQTLNQGQTPTSWAQIRQVYDVDVINKKLVGRQGYPIEDHYQFITQPMPFRSHSGVVSEGSQVLLMRTVPLGNLSEPDESQQKQWRYLVVRSKDGEISSIRLPEEDVQTMLKTAGVTITPKPGLPAVESEDRIPGTEPKPQPNPADAEFLKQHPELDPQRTGKRMAEGVPPPSFTPSPEPLKPQSSSIPTTSTPSTPESPASNWLLVGLMTLAVVLACAVAWKFLPK